MQFHMMTLLDVLGKIAFYPRVKSQISLSGVQEIDMRVHVCIFHPFCVYLQVSHEQKIRK